MGIAHTIDLGLSGKRALVTGASKGIGYGVALTLAQHGANIVAVARDEAGLAGVAKAVRGSGRACHTIRADLAQLDEVQAAADEALSHEVVDILVNNAGVSYPESALETTPERWDHTFAVNVRAAFFLAQRLAKPMLGRRWGRVVNLSSQSGLVALENHAAYCSSKGALELLSKVMALEWAPFGVTVDCVAPTVIATPMADTAFPTEAAKENMLSASPWGALDRSQRSRRRFSSSPRPPQR